MGDFYFESAMDRISDFMASNSTMPKDAYASIYNSRFRMNSGLRIIEHESIDDISDWDEQETSQKLQALYSSTSSLPNK